MTSLSAQVPQPMRSPWSFMGSICLHAWVLAWVAMGPSLSLERAKSLYENELQPSEKHIVWYKLSDRLPDVTPPEAKRDARPLRARAKFDQNMAAGPRDLARPPQLILAPAPEITPAKPLPLPNIVAIASPQRPPARLFLPPPDKPRAPAPAPALPDAPKLAVAAPEVKAPALDLKAPRPIRRFTPPKEPKKPLPSDPPPLPDAPKLAVAAPEVKAPPLDVKAPRPIRRFTPPKEPKKPLPSDPPPLPDAPKLAVAAPEVKAPAIDVKAPRPIRRFTPPKEPIEPPPSDPSALPTAPEMAPGAPNLTAAVSLPRQQHPFVAPAKQPTPRAQPTAIATPPPALTSAAALPSENSLVIAGLNPAKSVEVPTPPGSVKAGFSGGPKPAPKGSEGTPTGAMLEIPSLTIQGGDKNPPPPVMVARVSPTSPEALAAALRDARGRTPATGSATRQAVRVSSVPDPRMYGRQVYSMAIQVPNLTSYSGSWLVWFAGREQDAGNPSVEMHPPLPLHMVSPKYVNSAAEERVEGKVRLWAVIGKDGRVADISLLQHLDDRLDRSAEEALGKWLFQPAARRGVPVDVDAVFEIPFNLAPKAER